MEFKKLADVNLLESAPENATAFAEVNGEVVRVKGGVGGSSYAYDFTDKVIELMTSEEPRYEIQENLMAWSPTWEEVQEIIEKAMEVDNFKLKADVAKIFKATGEDEEFANTDFFVSYEGPMNMKMYNKENR